GFMDPRPLRIHDWREHNGYHQFYAERAKKAAAARWQKERSKEKDSTLPDKIRGDKSQALLQASDGSSANAHAPPDLKSKKKPEGCKHRKDEARQKKRIIELEKYANPDWGLINGLKADRAETQKQIRDRGPSTRKPKPPAPKTEHSVLIPDGDREVGPVDWA